MAKTESAARSISRLMRLVLITSRFGTRDVKKLRFSRTGKDRAVVEDIGMAYGHVHSGIGKRDLDAYGITMDQLESYMIRYGASPLHR